MGNNIIVRWYNQNRKTIWIVILTIAGVIFLMESLNNYYAKKAKNESSSTISATTYNTTNYSVISNEEIDYTASEQSVDLIENFFTFCNNGKIEDAYNLISTDCKEELYPTINDFTTKYYNIIFAEKRSYDSLLWIANSSKNTYRIQIMKDLLSSGQRDDMPIEEYYTIIMENGQYKLSISNYIGKEEINASKTQNNITVSVLAKKIYIDYEIYEIKIENNAGNKLIFNTKENTKSIYIQDENELKYIAFLNEIPDSELEIGINKILEIKFNRGYKPTINIEKIVFENIKNNEQIESMEIEL